LARRLQIAGLSPLRQLDLLSRREQRDRMDRAQVRSQTVLGVEDLVAFFQLIELVIELVAARLEVARRGFRRQQVVSGCRRSRRVPIHRVQRVHHPPSVVGRVAEVLVEDTAGDVVGHERVV